MFCLDNFLSSEKYAKIVKLRKKSPQLGSKAIFFQSALLPGLYLLWSHALNNKASELLEEMLFLFHMKSQIRPFKHTLFSSALQSSSPYTWKFSDGIFSGNGEMEITRSDRFGDSPYLHTDKNDIQVACPSVPTLIHIFRHPSPEQSCCFYTWWYLKELGPNIGGGYCITQVLLLFLVSPRLFIYAVTSANTLTLHGDDKNIWSI